MKSITPKVLHPITNRPMIRLVLDALSKIEPVKTVVVVAPNMKKVEEAVRPAKIAIQTEPLGTGNAVVAAQEILGEFEGDILILFGDTPLLTSKTIQKLLTARRGNDNPAIVVLGFRSDDPAEYGRLVIGKDGSLEKIVEAADLPEELKELSFCNSGVMAVDGKQLFSLLGELKNINSKSEYYLTDIVQIARQRGLKCKALEASSYTEVMGINTRSQLADAEAAMQVRLRNKAMSEGVTLRDPNSVWFSADTVIGRDVVIGPNVYFGPGVKINDNAEIRSFCHIEGAEIETDVLIGPFARLRPGAKLGKNTQIGNFVEIKESTLEEDVKVNHLTYIGDAHIGKKTNIGAGTITCNYDGFSKHKTVIGEGSFVGSNTAFVAPIAIGDGVVVAAGSVVTNDVESDALVVTRGKPRVIEGWAKKFRNTGRAIKNQSRKK